MTSHTIDRLSGTPLESDYLLHSELDERSTLRRSELLEAFVAHCRANLSGPLGDAALDRLHVEFGLPGHRVAKLPLGVYSTPRDVRKHLVDLGFTAAEVQAAAVTGDPRLCGRLIIPWRNEQGELRTVVARSLGEQDNDRAARLYLAGGTRTELFGLDTALQQSAGGREHLVLVEGLLDVVYLHAMGVTNVAAVGSRGRVPTVHHWQTLAQLGVQRVTLALADNPAGWQRTYRAIENSNQSEQSPHLFALSPGDLGSHDDAAGLVRRRGVQQWQEVLRRRVHAYRYAAKALVGRFRDGAAASDAAVIDLLCEATQFDAQVHLPRRVLEMERFFWPTIVRAADVEWDHVRPLLADRTRSLPSRSLGAWPVRNLKALLRDLYLALRDGDLDRFRLLLRTAADDMSAVKTKRAERPAPPPAKPVEEKKAPPPAKVQLQWTDVAVGDVINAVHVETEPSSAVLSVIETPVAALWDEFAFPPPAASETEEPPVEEASKPQPPPSLDDIRRLAYLLWERNGRPDDSDRHFWTLAEKLLTPGEPDVIPFRPLSDAEPPADVAAPAPKAAIG